MGGRIGVARREDQPLSLQRTSGTAAPGYDGRFYIDDPVPVPFVDGKGAGIRHGDEPGSNKFFLPRHGLNIVTPPSSKRTAGTKPIRERRSCRKTRFAPIATAFGS